MCGINAAEAQGCECMFTFCHAYPKMGVLLHKVAIVCNLMLLAVNDLVIIFRESRYSEQLATTNMYKPLE